MLICYNFIKDKYLGKNVLFLPTNLFVIYFDLPTFKKNYQKDTPLISWFKDPIVTAKLIPDNTVDFLVTE